MVAQVSQSFHLSAARKDELIQALQKFPGEWKLTPVGGNKAPYRRNWQNEKLERREIAAEIKSNRAKGYGLLTGQVSGGILAIDADGEDAHALLAKYGELPRTVAFTSGRPGRCQYLLRVGEEFWSVAKTTKLNSGVEGDDGKKQLLEFRWDGCQSVLPPSMHPLTGQYQWGVSPDEIAIAECPTWVIELMLNAEAQEQPQLQPQPQHRTRYEDITVPVPASIPLDDCLAKESRNLLGGVSEGGRNDAGAKLARDLIGTANYLRSIGQVFDGDPQSLFDGFASRCSPPLPAREASTIWKSAERSNPSPACKSDGVDNCVRAWYWNNHVKAGNTPKASWHERATRHSQTAIASKSLTLQQAADRAKTVLTQNIPALNANIELEEIRRACGMGSFDWENKILKPLKRDLEGDRFKLELLGLLQMEDEVERERLIAQLAPKYSMSAGRIEKAMGMMKARTQTPETKVLDLDELFDMEVEGLSWIAPGLLPQNETVILAGIPKSGKTLLAFDLAYAAATGEANFLGEATMQGRVLLISTDESAASTRTKLLNRGFRRCDKDSIKVITSWDISQMATLEKILEDFRPNLTIIDSLRRINKGSEISENSAEFADNIYTLKETLSRYGSAGVLIHHLNKNNEAMGVNRLRGSSAIAGATWGVWQIDHLPKPDPNNKKKLIIDPKDPRRVLSVFARDSEGQQLNIELSLEDSSWRNLGGGESDAEQAAKQTIRDRIMRVLSLNPGGIGGRDIIEAIDDPDINKNSVYNELASLERKRLINSKPAPNDKRYRIFSLPGVVRAQQTSTLPPLPPPVSVANMTNSSEIHIQQGLEDSHIDSHALVMSKTGTLNTQMPETPAQSETDNSHIFSTGTRGGGVKGVVCESRSSDILHSVPALEQQYLSPPPPPEQPPFKVGDRVVALVAPDKGREGTITVRGKDGTYTVDFGGDATRYEASELAPAPLIPTLGIVVPPAPKSDEGNPKGRRLR